MPEQFTSKPQPSSSRFAVPLVQMAILVVGFSVLRLVLFCRFGPSSVSFADLVKTFLVGLHLDLLTAGLMVLPVGLWIILCPDRIYGWRVHRLFLRAVLVLGWTVMLFLLIAEYYFFDEFKSRFNTVAIDYLLYPHEVFFNIWDTYPVGVVLMASVVFGAMAVLLQEPILQKTWSTSLSGRRLAPLAGALGALAILYFTASLKESAFSNERLLTEISRNGPFSVTSAALTRQLDYHAFYKTLPREEAYARARKMMAEEGDDFVESGEALERRVGGSLDRPRLNVVLLLEESFGSEFWGVLGSRFNGLTPEMDKLANEAGLLFTNIYASGNRTVRGLEGVLSSFPPLPGDSIVVRNLSDNVETMARILKRDGYSTLFLYGGRGIFDHMRSFALRNGYDRFIERKNFRAPKFTTVWGVCDEELYARTIDECRAMAESGKPFFATVLSVSNHKPFTYPAGRIPENPNQRKRENAVKYADYALGRFFEAAKKEAFYSNTVFVVVADHGARVYGSQNVPIHSYEIPFLVTGPAVVKAPRRIGRLGCSLDVAPTILGLLGRPYETVFFGKDLLKPSSRDDYVLLNHNRDIGLYRNGRLITMGLNRSEEFYRGNPKAEEMRRVRELDSIDYELERDAISLFQTADDLYMRQQYRIRPVRSAVRN